MMKTTYLSGQNMVPVREPQEHIYSLCELRFPSVYNRDHKITIPWLFWKLTHAEITACYI